MENGEAAQVFKGVPASIGAHLRRGVRQGEITVWRFKFAEEAARSGAQVDTR